MSSIYEITAEYAELQQMLEEGEIDDEVFSDTLSGIDGELEIKAEQYAKIMKNLESQMNGLMTESKRLENRARVIDNNITRMKTALEGAMRVSGKMKFKTDLFSFGIQKNPASVVILDETKIPQEYLIPQPPKINKTAIKDFLKGLDENATCEFAELNQSESLRVR